jgi:hypothetical protein
LPLYDLDGKTSLLDTRVTDEWDKFDVGEVGVEAIEEVVPAESGLGNWLSPDCLMKKDLKARTP